MRVKEFYKRYYPHKLVLYNHEVSDVTDDSKHVTKGSVFVAIKGYLEDGHDYLLEVVKKGAKTLIINEDYHFNYPGVNIIGSKSPKQDFARFLNLFFTSTRTKTFLIGVTGTNGKTTTTTILYNYFKYRHYDTLLIGSNGSYCYYGMKETFVPTKNTTPNIGEIYHLIYEHPFNYDYVIMEVSSQGICEGRVLGLDFKRIIVTNLASDHLDYHLSILSYKEAKGSLIRGMNQDLDYELILNRNLNYFDYFNNLTTCLTTTFKAVDEANLISDESDIKGMIKSESLDKTEGIVLYNNDQYELNTNLVGKFNWENVLACLSLIITIKEKINDFIAFLKQPIIIKGRMNLIKHQGRYFIIDFAHNSGGVEEVLKFGQKVVPGKIITVIGCGGERDRNKRPIMGELVTRLSDLVIFTEDNSRKESLILIINDIIKGVNKNNYKIILDRKAAIKEAIILSEVNDLIFILGKGNEPTIKRNNEEVVFNDQDVLLDCFKELI